MTIGFATERDMSIEQIIASQETCKAITYDLGCDLDGDMYMMLEIDEVQGHLTRNCKFLIDFTKKQWITEY